MWYKNADQTRGVRSRAKPGSFVQQYLLGERLEKAKGTKLRRGPVHCCGRQDPAVAGRWQTDLAGAHEHGRAHDRGFAVLRDFRHLLEWTRKPIEHARHRGRGWCQCAVQDCLGEGEALGKPLPSAVQVATLLRTRWPRPVSGGSSGDCTSSHWRRYAGSGRAHPARRSGLTPSRGLALHLKPTLRGRLFHL